MAAGDTTNPEQVRFESNERVDRVDVATLAQQERTFFDSATRAALFSSRATAGGPVGLVATGGTLVANPTGPSDGKVRIPSDLLVIFDADGRWVCKPAGTVIDVAIPAGGAQYQIYVYYVQIPGKTAQRRAIPASPPYTEFTALINTANRDSLSVYVRAGSLASAVPSDVVNGVTTNLCLLGTASNTTGVVSISFQTANRLSTIAPPATLPTSSTDSGSLKTLHDLESAVAYGLARLKFNEPGVGSGTTASVTSGAALGFTRYTGLSGMTASMVRSFVTITGAAAADLNGTFEIGNVVSGTVADLRTLSAATTDANNGAIAWSLFNHVLPGVGAAPGAVNNYGGYAEARRGVDVVDRSTFAITIGDGTTTFGVFDRTQFSNDSDLLIAALTLACSVGGEVVLKQGLNLNNFTKDMSFSASGHTVTIRSVEKAALRFGAFKLSLSAGIFYLSDLTLTCTSTGLAFTNAFAIFQSCDLTYTSGTTNPAVTMTGGGKLFVDECVLKATVSGADSTANVSIISVSASGTLGIDVNLSRSRVSVAGSARIAVKVDQGGFKAITSFSDVYFYKTDVVGYVANPSVVAVVNAPGGAFVRNCQFVSAAAGASELIGLEFDNIAVVSVVGSTFDHVFTGILAGLTVDAVKIDGCTFYNTGASNALACTGIEFLPANSVQNFNVNNCTFTDNRSIRIHGFPGVVEMQVSGCSFSSVVDGMDAPAIFGNVSTSRIELVWTGNQHFNYFNTTSQNVAFGLFLQASVINAVVSGNKFLNIQQSGTFTGLPNSIPSFVFIDATTQRWAVTGNVVTNSGSIGITSGIPHALVLVYSLSSIGAWKLESGVVGANSVGDSISKVGLLVVENPVCQSLVVSGNSVYAKGHNFAVAFEENLTVTLNASTISGMIAVIGNNFYFEAPTSGASFIKVGGKWTSMVLQGNSFTATSGTAPFTQNFFGEPSSISVVMIGNIAAKLGDTSTSPIMKITMATPTNFNENGVATLPASGSPFPQNININRT